MPKLKNLDNIEKFAIQGMLQNGKTVEEIAVELDRRVELIHNYIDELSASKTKIAANKKKDAGKKAATPKMPTAKDFMINKSAGGRTGVVMMTQTAAEHSDDAVKKSGSKHDPSIIYRRED